MRRLRRSQLLRDFVSETQIDVKDLIYPLFVEEGLKDKKPISAMPNQFRYSVESLLKKLEYLIEIGIPAIILFGIPAKKDSLGSSAYDKNGIIQQAVKKTKDEFGDDLIVITDICLCEYTDHGHCGIVKGNEILNDKTLEVLAKIAVSHAEAGADIVAPSDMMDGRVGTIRDALDKEGFSNTLIMSYAAKYASTFYGPFREAAESAPSFGDRRSYQMDPRNANEALREVYLDIQEGADIIMVKPALSYLDVLYRVKKEFGYPTAAYNVSGEYTMIKLMAEKGYIKEKDAVLEVLNSIKRAGADMILTYFAEDLARWLRSEV
ncbi:MAG: porphobilinogen synthase [Candidatus Hydrothermarchaeota archaeon]